MSVGVLLAAVAVVVGLAAGSIDRITSQAAYTPPPASMFGATAPPSPSAFAVPPGSRVLVFGDSYTAGYGAEPATEGYAYKLATLTEWNVEVEGIGSTGYLNAGNDNQGTFKQRLDSLEYGDEFDLVILQGGSNDQRVQDRDLSAAIDEVASTIEQRFPSAQLVVVGPVSVGTNANEDKKRIDRALRAYTRAQGVYYVSPVGATWFHTSDQPALVNMAVGHPNNEGYTVMAEKLLAAIERIAVG